MPALNAERRAQLARVLARPVSSSDGELLAAAHQLRAALDARSRREDSTDEAATRLAEEIASLDQAIKRLEASASAARHRPDRLPLLGALAGVALTIVVLAAQTWDAGPASTDEPRATILRHTARLVIDGPQPGAVLRVLDADRSTVLVERPAQGADVELRRGRYALEVRRHGCPDVWTRSAWFEGGATRHFEPALCTGEGRLTIQSNVDGGTLSIDGVEVGSTDDGALPLAVGEYDVEVSKRGYQTHVGRLRIRADETLELRADLVPERDSAAAARGLDLSFEAAALTPPEVSEHTPFDLGALAASIAPEPSLEGGTRLLQRDGLGRLPDGGSTAWHDRVSREFRSRFDSDASGGIDRVEESESISCAYWRETEASFDRGGLGLSMARYYGFDGSEWHPGALGFDRDVRGAAYARMRECGLQA